jgi:hypothetical protein
MGLDAGPLGPRICDRSSRGHPGMGTRVSIHRTACLSDLVRQRPLSAGRGETRGDTYRNRHPCTFGAEDSRLETSARRLTRKRTPRARPPTVSFMPATSASCPARGHSRTLAQPTAALLASSGISARVLPEVQTPPLSSFSSLSRRTSLSASSSSQTTWRTVKETLAPAPPFVDRLSLRASCAPVRANPERSLAVSETRGRNGHKCASSAQIAANRPQMAGIWEERARSLGGHRKPRSYAVFGALGTRPTTRLPCRRSWVRVPSSASRKAPLRRGFLLPPQAPEPIRLSDRTVRRSGDCRAGASGRAHGRADVGWTYPSSRFRGTRYAQT